MILVDTNVPLRMAQPGHPHRQQALDAMASLRASRGEVFAICPQILYEMYVVCSRPVSANGLGMTPERAHAEIVGARALFQLLLETPQAYATWEGLVARYAPAGKRAHDARLVALMIEHHVPRLVTYNDDDFAQFEEITALNPFDVLGIPRV